MKLLLGLAVSILTLTGAINPVPAKPSAPTFITRASNDSIYATISWKQSINSAGPADYYIVDASFNSRTITGFPKKVVGLSTVAVVPQIAWGSSATFVADLRAVRRGLTSPAVAGRVTYKRVDKAPPPPQGLSVIVNEQPN